MISLDNIIPYNPAQPSTRSSEKSAQWREPPGIRWLYNRPRLGSTPDDAIELNDTQISEDSSIPGSMNIALALDSSKASPAFIPAGNGFVGTADEVYPLSSNLQLYQSAEKAGSGDDRDRDLNDVNSSTWKSDVGNSLSQDLRPHSVELSRLEDITSGYGQVTPCASLGQSEEPSDEIHYLGETSEAIHDIPNSEQLIGRVILESLTERPNGDDPVCYNVKLINTALQSQQDSVLVQEGQPEYSRLSAHRPVATEEKEPLPDHGTGGMANGNESEERSPDKRPSTKRTRSPSTSPEPIKRRRWHLRACSRIESEAEDASDAQHKMSRKRTRTRKRPIDGSQSATVPDGDWLIDGIVGERRGVKGREFMVQWRPTWVSARDVNAEHCKKQWKDQKRRMKTCGSRG